MEVGQAPVVQFPRKPGRQADRIAVDHGVETVQRREAQTHHGGFLAYGLKHLEQQPGPMLAAAAVGPLALVAAIAQELVQQVAVGAMDLHPIEPGGHGVAGRPLEVRHDRRQLPIVQGPGQHVGLLALGGVDRVARDRDRTGGHRLAAAIEQGMAGAAAMPELQHNPPAGLVHGVGGQAPARHLGLGVDAGLAPEGRMALTDHRCFGDQQAGRGPLGVVRGHQRPRLVAGFAAAAGQRRHPQPVGQLQGPNPNRAEQVGHGWIALGQERWSDSGRAVSP